VSHPLGSHPLDRPIWAALATRQAHFDTKGTIARRFPPDVSPFVAVGEDSAGAVAAAVELIPEGDDVSFLERAPPQAPAGVTATSAKGLQMVAKGFAAGGRDFEIKTLTSDDADEMLALATLTRPGPFRARTHTLGRFIGIRDGGRLVAMAGERLKLDGFVEISAVCTHPDYRGRGYGAALMKIVGQRILSEGDTPFLHTYADNAVAIALYKRLGFEVRSEVVHAVWKLAQV
jgi:ribosomal protein S18 acetylase RimI-like enzyme